jgi:hypothetical protein
VRVFFAGDAVHLVREATATAVHGLGTGNVAEHLAALRGAGARGDVASSRSESCGDGTATVWEATTSSGL